MPPKPETFLALSHRGRGCESPWGTRPLVAMGFRRPVLPMVDSEHGKCDIIRLAILPGRPWAGTGRCRLPTCEYRVRAGAMSASGRQRTLGCSRAGPRVNVHPAAAGKLVRSAYLYGAFLTGVLALVTGLGRADVEPFHRAAELISVGQWDPKAFPLSYGLP